MFQYQEWYSWNSFGVKEYTLYPFIYVGITSYKQYNLDENDLYFIFYSKTFIIQ